MVVIKPTFPLKTYFLEKRKTPDMELLYALLMISVCTFLVFWFLAPLFAKPRSARRKRASQDDDGWTVLSSSSLSNNDRDGENGWGDGGSDAGSDGGDSGGGDGGGGGD
jgi:uncharacterized membrane protein YgcG